MGTVRRKGCFSAAACAVLALLPAAAMASPGDLDPGFAEYGKFSRGGSSANAVAVQPDGKTLVLASSSIRRLATDGSVDESYGKKGVAETGLPQGYSGSQATDIAALADGASLVIAYVNTKDGDVSLAVARHLANGKLDTSFGASGIASIPLGGGGIDSGTTPRLAVEAGGGIVIAAANGDVTKVARLSPTGAPDPSFGGGQPVSVALGAEGVFSDLAIGPDGKVVVVGTVAGAGNKQTDIAVGRLNPDGTPDATFSGDGLAVANLGEREVASAVAVQPDAKIVVAGTNRFDCSGDECESTVAVTRFDATGAPDAGFGQAGIVTADPPSGIGAEVVGVQIAADGKIVVGGGGNNFLVARFGSDGSLDTAFGDAGLQWTGFRGIYPAYATGMALTPAGDIVIAGYILLEEYYDELAIARYLGGAGGASDIDADGVSDSDDDCPRSFGTIASGCPFVSRELQLKYDEDKRRVTGRIATSQRSGEPLSGYLAGTPRYCAGNAGGSVVLFEKSRGADRRVAVDRKPSNLEFKVKGDGKYYARVKKALVTVFEPDGPVELCGADESKPVRVG